MSDMIRGLPLGQQSTQQMYQAPPSTLQTLGALGMGAYGVNQMFGSPTPGKAEGGEIKSYAGNDGSVTSQGNKDAIVDDMYSIEALQRAKEFALNRRDMDTVAAIDERIAELNAIQAQSASLDYGLGSAFDQIPQERQEAMMAGGGIVAFKDAGSVEEEEEEEEEDQTAALDKNQLFANSYSPGNQANFDMFNKEILKSMENVRNYQPSAPMTDADRRAATAANYKEIEAMAGPSPYEAQAARIADLEKQQAGELRQQRGLSAFAAIPAILQGSNAIRGLGAGAGKFGDMYGKALQADRAEKRSLMSMKNNLEDAQYKLRVGLVGDARQLTAEARRDKQAADAAGIAKQRALGALAAQGATLNKPQRPLAAKGTTPKPPKVNEMLAEAEINYANNPNEANRKRVEALRSTVAQIRTSDTGPVKTSVATSELSSKEADEAITKAKKAKIFSEDWQNASSDAEKATIEKRLIDEEIQKKIDAKQKLSGNKPAASPKPSAIALPPGAPAGSTLGKFVQGKGTEVIKNGKVIGYAN